MSTRVGRGSDGTRLRAWCNDGTGAPGPLWNGLGAPAAAWPRVVARTSGFRVVTWDHRGLGGAARPADRGPGGGGGHAGEAPAGPDAFELPTATVIGWSLGVNVAFELALEEPSRVQAVLAVAGVPGGSFASLFGPYRVPRSQRARMGRLSSRLLPVIGPLMPVLVAS